MTKFDPMQTRQERLAKLASLRPLVQEHSERADELQEQSRSDREVGEHRIETVSQIGIVPDFHPTPDPLAIRMIAEANLSPGMTVCEPSAGTGAIADHIRAVPFRIHLTLIEQQWKFCEMLIKRGYENVRCMDFLEHVGVYDRFIMNPPFSQLQDVEHVMYAYLLLARGGRIVAIMGESAFHNSQKKAQAFREWLAQKGGTSEQLPDGTFKSSGTGARAWLVIIDKP